MVDDKLLYGLFGRNQFQPRLRAQRIFLKCGIRRVLAVTWYNGGDSVAEHCQYWRVPRNEDRLPKFFGRVFGAFFTSHLYEVAAGSGLLKQRHNLWLLAA